MNNHFNPFMTERASEPILRDVFQGWELGKGIFYYIESVSDMPWKDVETVDSSVLDVEYFANHSGAKFCTPIVKYFLDDDGIVPVSARETIAKIIVSKYFTNWERLWRTNVLEYDPVTNYDMHETRNLARSGSEAEVEGGVDTHGGTVTLAHGKVETTAHGRTNDDTSYKFGLNTDIEDPKPADRIVSTEGGNTTVTDSGNDITTNNLTDTTTKSRNSVDASAEDETLHRVGNIGVTTNQRLIQEERALWVWNYFDQIFGDLDRELALQFHDSCRV